MENGSALNILYLEPDERLHTLFRHTLESLQYNIYFAKTKANALTQLTSQPFDLLAVSTTVLKAETAFMATVQQRPTAPPILIMGQPGDESIAAEGLAQGGSAVLIIDEQDRWVEMLLAVVKKSLRRHRLENARLIETLRQNSAILEERNAELDAFGHTVAHDLQNMLGRVIGFSEYLLQETAAVENDSVPSELVTKSASIIARDGRKMSMVIESLMLLSAVRQADIEVSTIDTKKLVDEAVSRLSHHIEAKSAVISYPDAWPAAVGYGPWIEEVWYNYLSNALKYGGSPPEIELSGAISPGDELVRFSIKDSGVGIPEHLKDELFHPFTDYSRVREQGAGLGLSIVSRIVTRLGGAAGFENLPDGVCFWFTLPAK